MTKRNRAIANEWISKATKHELFDVMDEAMLTPLQQDIIMLRCKDESIVHVSLAVDFSDSKINKEIAKARDKIFRVLKLRHILN